MFSDAPRGIGERLTDFSAAAGRLLAQQAVPAVPAGLPSADMALVDAASLRASFAGLPPGDTGGLRSALIDLRRRVWLKSCVLECNLLISLEQATAAFTTFAEVAIETALHHLEIVAGAKHGQPIGEYSGTPSALSVIALGRLGEATLGPACDVDLVFIFDEEGQTDGDSRIDNKIYYSQLAADLFRLLGEDHSGSFVLRLYNRKQPWGGNVPSACSLSALERYVTSRLDEGERGTWVAARVLHGPQAPLENVIQPFVFRRFLDYSVFSTIREHHASLRREIAHAGLGDNIRLGPGGLREIEFLIHTFQLIRGGRDKRLRTHSTLAVLDAMMHRRELPTATALALGEAYLFLRRLEHRLQYRNDELVHSLPADEASLELLGAAMGYADGTSFVNAHDAQRGIVEQHFRSVFQDPGDDTGDLLLDIWHGECSDAHALNTLQLVGYETPEQSLALIVGLRVSNGSQNMNAKGRHSLERLVPPMLRLCGEQQNADEVLKRVTQVFEVLCQRPVYLDLLAQYPSVLERFTRFCAASPWVTHYLAQHPILLDELLYPEHLVETMDGTGLTRSLAKILDHEGQGDHEKEMELCCEFRQVHTFRLVARELLLGTTPRELGNQLSILAESILAEVINRVWAGMLTRHRETPRFAVIAYGKHGSRELSYASDLDLVFVFEDDDPGAQEIYVRLAKRLLAWFNAVTNAGTLFDVDMRLRPDGDSGVLVPSLGSLADYLNTRAWNWEHQALTRARFAVGHPEVGAGFEAIRHAVLCRQRENETLANEVLDMRRRISEGHPNKGELFGLKHDRGGLVDVEFAVQYLILAHAHEHPALAEHKDNAALLETAGRIGLLDPVIAADAGHAYERLRQLQHGLRLQGVETARVEPEQVECEVDAIRTLWNRVFRAQLG